MEPSGRSRSDELTDDLWLSVDGRRARALAEGLVEGVDVIVVLLDSFLGRANADGGEPPIVRINTEDGGRTLTHELGHALFGLGDEYGEVPACFDDSPSDLATEHDPFLTVANLSLDPDGTKWADLVEGAREGGMRYDRCVYHPTDRCRMLNRDDDRFCPVCDDAIRRTLAARDGDAPNP